MGIGHDRSGRVVEVSEHLLAHIAIIIILAKLFSALSTRLRQPPVLGMLAIGLLIGPSGFGLIKSDSVIQVFAEIGVILLLFEAGLETELERIKKTGKSSLIVAAHGVVLPLAGGALLGMAFHLPLCESLVLGLVLTATSVSVTVMTLLDMKKIQSVEGATIMSAAIIDDVVGIMLLTVLFSFFGETEHTFVTVMLRLGVYVVLALLIALFLLRPLFNLVRTARGDDLELSLGFALSFLYSWGAKIAGMASITGAYFAGFFTGQTKSRNQVLQGIRSMGQSLFVPIFFINIGLETNLREGGFNVLFVVLFIALAIVTKIAGGLIGARIGGFSTRRSLRIGVGLVPRGEVALVVANMAMAGGLIGSEFFGTIVLMVVVTAMLTPTMLRAAFGAEEES